MPLSLQARLLRVLQERCVTPLGSHKSIPVDIAVVSATHRNLREMCAAQSFREDLYYRLNGLVVRLPALRDRSDLRTVARRIVLAESPDAPPQVSASVMALFECYAWPGNIRQLANVLRTAVVMAGNESQITEEHLSEDFLEDVRRQPASTATPATVATSAARSVPLPAASSVPPPAAPAGAADPIAAAPAPAPAAAPARTLGESEIALIQAALDAAGGNISEASKALGISRNTIYRKLRWR
jgi:transcriptional regulator of acetoin/glycerol metabolism